MRQWNNLTITGTSRSTNAISVDVYVVSVISVHPELPDVRIAMGKLEAPRKPRLDCAVLVVAKAGLELEGWVHLHLDSPHSIQRRRHRRQALEYLAFAPSAAPAGHADRSESGERRSRIPDASTHSQLSCSNATRSNCETMCATSTMLTRTPRRQSPPSRVSDAVAPCVEKHAERLTRAHKRGTCRQTWFMAGAQSQLRTWLRRRP